MRFKTFMRRIIGETGPEVVPFGREHFTEAGLGYAPFAGMPILEAYELVNKWNRIQYAPRFIYWLEA